MSNEDSKKREPREIPGFLCVSYAQQNKTLQYYVAIKDISGIAILSDGHVRIDYCGAFNESNIIVDEDEETVLERLLRAIHPMYTIRKHLDSPIKE